MCWMTWRVISDRPCHVSRGVVHQRLRQGAVHPHIVAASLLRGVAQGPVNHKNVKKRARETLERVYKEAPGFRPAPHTA